MAAIRTEISAGSFGLALRALWPRSPVSHFATELTGAQHKFCECWSVCLRNCPETPTKLVGSLLSRVKFCLIDRQCRHDKIPTIEEGEMREHLMTMTGDIGLSVASGESDCELVIKARKVRRVDRTLPASFIPERPALSRFTALRSCAALIQHVQ